MMKGKFFSVLISLYFWFTLFFLSAIFFTIALLIWLVTFLSDKNRRILHRYTILWSDVVFALNPIWKVTVTGRDKIDPSTAYVMVANHQSGADIMVLFKLHTHFKWVAKKGLFVIPFIGWNMRLNRYIPIERSVGRSKLMMMDHAKESLLEGNSVMIFPEGTRSRDGFVHGFKSGAFRLALETETPILPIVVTGTFKAIRKGGFLVRKNKHIRVIVLDPVPYESFRSTDAKTLASAVQHDIASTFMIYYNE